MQALVVDDHALIRDAVCGVLGGIDGIGRVHEAATAADAQRLVAEIPTIGLVLLDIGLPDCDGLTLLSSLRRNHPAVSVVVLSGTEERTVMTAALEAGATGFIPKSASRGVMRGALQLVLSGGIYVPPEILARHAVTVTRGQAPNQPRTAARLGLTDRQAEVLRHMMTGKSNKEICRLLDISEPTVKNHVTAILRALGATNRTEAVIAATAIESNADRST